jgi:uncharacterized protein YlxP (DUF503 family)
VIEKVRALVMRKDVLGLVAVASERRRTERVIDAIVDFVECVVMYKSLVQREQLNSTTATRELHLQ